LSFEITLQFYHNKIKKSRENPEGNAT